MSPPNETAPESEDLLARAKGGDREAFGALVKAHQRPILTFALRVLGNATEAEDALQETFLRAFRALPKYDGKLPLPAWLLRLVVNVCLNILRRRRRTRSPADGPDPRVPDGDADGEGGGTYARLAAGLDGLVPSLRVTAVLLSMPGVSLSDAAAILGCPETTVAWRAHEARRKLRDALRGDGARGGGS